jgi:hypothetical protein
MPLMPARQYLTELRDAAAQSLAEMPPRGRPDEAVIDRIFDRLEPYVADTALAYCNFNDDGTLHGINDAASIQYLTDTLSAERGVGTVPYIHGGNAGVNEV